MKIITPNKTYKVKEVEHPISKWLDVIERSKIELKNKLERRSKGKK